MLNFPNASGLWRQPGSREQVALTQEGSRRGFPQRETGSDGGSAKGEKALSSWGPSGLKGPNSQLSVTKARVRAPRPHTSVCDLKGIFPRKTATLPRYYLLALSSHRLRKACGRPSDPPRQHTLRSRPRARAVRMRRPPAPPRRAGAVATSGTCQPLPLGLGPPPAPAGACSRRLTRVREFNAPSLSGRPDLR